MLSLTQIGQKVLGIGGVVFVVVHRCGDRGNDAAAAALHQIRLDLDVLHVRRVDVVCAE